MNGTAIKASKATRIAVSEPAASGLNPQAGSRVQRWTWRTDRSIGQAETPGMKGVRWRPDQREHLPASNVANTHAHHARPTDPSQPDRGRRHDGRSLAGCAMCCSICFCRPGIPERLARHPATVRLAGSGLIGGEQAMHATGASRPCGIQNPVMNFGGSCRASVY